VGEDGEDGSELMCGYGSRENRLGAVMDSADVDTDVSPVRHEPRAEGAGVPRNRADSEQEKNPKLDRK